jgi:hypothetical protein
MKTLPVYFFLSFLRKQVHPNKQTMNAFVRFLEEESAHKAAEEA